MSGIHPTVTRPLWLSFCAASCLLWRLLYTVVLGDSEEKHVYSIRLVIAQRTKLADAHIAI